MLSTWVIRMCIPRLCNCVWVHCNRVAARDVSYSWPGWKIYRTLHTDEVSAWNESVGAEPNSACEWSQRYSLEKERKKKSFKMQSSVLCLKYRMVQNSVEWIGPIGTLFNFFLVVSYMENFKRALLLHKHLQDVAGLSREMYMPSFLSTLIFWSMLTHQVGHISWFVPNGSFGDSWIQMHETWRIRNLGRGTSSHWNESPYGPSTRVSI